MSYEIALARVLALITLLQKREEDTKFSKAHREQMKADRIALEIVVEWAMKAYKKDNELGAEMLNALHV